MPFRMRIRAVGRGMGHRGAVFAPRGSSIPIMENLPPSPRSASLHRGWSRGFDGEPVLEGGGGGRPEPVPTVRVISVCVGQQKRSPLVPRSASGALTGRARAADACGGAGAGRERAGPPPSGGLPQDGRPPGRQRTETVPRFRSSRRAHE